MVTFRKSIAPIWPVFVFYDYICRKIRVFTCSLAGVCWLNSYFKTELLNKTNIFLQGDFSVPKSGDKWPSFSTKKRKRACNQSAFQ